MRDERTEWEARYRAAAGRAPDPPSFFVSRWAPRLHGRVVDIACGSGRNSLLLARHGLQVEAVDISPTALGILQAAAAYEGLNIGTHTADLGTWDPPAGTYDVVVQVRYLQRTLFPALKRAIKPGGVALLETFLIDQREYGHPKNPDFLLARGELRATFAGWEILDAEEGRLDTETTPAFLSRLAARKPLA